MQNYAFDRELKVLFWRVSHLSCWTEKLVIDLAQPSRGWGWGLGIVSQELTWSIIQTINEAVYSMQPDIITHTTYNISTCNVT